MGNCWECFSRTRVPSRWLTPSSCSRLRSSPFYFSPGSVLPFGSQSQLPPGGLGGLSVPSRHITTSEGQPSLHSQPAGVTESVRPPCWSLEVGAVL